MNTKSILLWIFLSFVVCGVLSAEVFYTLSAGTGIATGRSLVGSHDINHDTKPDVVVGLPKIGQVHVLLSIISAQSPNYVLTTPYSNPNASNFGWSVAIGDCNGDSWDDIFVGASDEDKVYGFYGSSNGLSLTPNITLVGPTGSAFGISLAVGDPNNDNITDLLVGASNYTNDQTLEGAAYLFLGYLGSGIDVNSVWSQESNVANSLFGFSVAFADTQQDGYEEALIGAPWYTGVYVTQGAVYIFNGTSGGLLNSSKILKVNSDYALFGYTVGRLMDVNGDTYEDIGVSALNQSGGIFYWYKGSSSGVSLGGTLSSPSYPNGAGLSFAGLGDLNLDNCGEVLVGGYGAWSLGPGGYGGLGGVALFAYITNSTTFGNVVAQAGDVDLDGNLDLLYGDPGQNLIALFYSNGNPLIGIASPTPTSSPTPSITPTPSPTPSITPTPSASITPGWSPSTSPTPTSSATPSATPSASISSTASPEVTPSASPISDHSKKNKNSNIGAIVGGVVGGIAGVALGAVLAVFIVKRRNRRNEPEQDSEVPMQDTNNRNESHYQPAALNSHYTTSNQTYQGMPNGTRDEDDTKKSLKKSSDEVVQKANELLSQHWEIEYDEIKLGSEIGRGGFGVVYKARWSNCDCVVKQLNINQSDQKAINDFLKEAETVKFLRNHKNICSIFGVCTNPAYPICIVMEYVSGGNLQKLRFNNELVPDSPMIIKIAQDVCAGMSHLHRVNVLHCDLACRNLLVEQQGSNITIKITDFGLSHISNSDVYDASRKTVFPIRWSAPEVLTQLKLSRASDVWSFGVCMWEILEAKVPYYKLSNPEVMDHVCEDKKILPKPTAIQYPPTVYDIMLKCWAFEPSQRPSFDELFDMFAKLDETGAENTNKVQKTDSDEEVDGQVYGSRSMNVYFTKE